MQGWQCKFQYNWSSVLILKDWSFVAFLRIYFLTFLVSKVFPYYHRGEAPSNWHLILVIDLQCSSFKKFHERCRNGNANFSPIDLQCYSILKIKVYFLINSCQTLPSDFLQSLLNFSLFLIFGGFLETFTKVAHFLGPSLCLEIVCWEFLIWCFHFFLLLR